MRGWLKSRSGRFLGVLLALFLGWLGLLAWLNSGIGKSVIETRLSEAMGRPVQLGEELRISLVPVPGAVGSDLQIFARNADVPVLAAGDYLVQLELWPLLKGEVEVVALQASDAVMDLGVMQSEAPPDGSSQDGLPAIPGVQRFELLNTAVYPAGVEAGSFLQVSNLAVNGFRVGQAAEFSSQARWIMEEGKAVDLGVSGQLSIEEQGGVIIELLDLDIDYESWRIANLSGRLVVAPVDSTVNFNLDWSDGEQEFGLRTRIGTSPEFSGGQDGLLIDELTMELDEHSITGKGCLVFGEPAQLHLDLSAPRMKLGDLKVLGEKWSTPTAQSPDSGDERDELPFGLAARLVIDQASYEDTVAEGIVITAGPGPECPERL